VACDVWLVTGGFRRLQSELMALMGSRDPGVSAFPEGENIRCWAATIEGSKGTVYEGLRYKLTLRVPSDYPFKPPQVKFDTFCFHPNVDQHGNICLDILKVRTTLTHPVRTLCGPCTDPVRCTRVTTQRHAGFTKGPSCMSFTILAVVVCVFGFDVCRRSGPLRMTSGVCFCPSSPYSEVRSQGGLSLLGIGSQQPELTGVLETAGRARRHGSLTTGVPQVLRRAVPRKPCFFPKTLLCALTLPCLCRAQQRQPSEHSGCCALGPPAR